MFAGDFAAEPVHIVVVAFNLHDIRLVDQIAEDLRGFKVGRDEHITLHARCGCMRRHGVGQVAG